MRSGCVRPLALQQAVDTVLDHPAGRQAGQFVVVGRAEQLVLERLLSSLMSADVESTRLWPAICTGRCEVRKTRLCAPDATASSTPRAALAQQIEAGLVPIVVRRRHGRACGHLQLGQGGVVDQQEFALFVLNGHARGKQEARTSRKYTQFAVEIAFTISLRRDAARSLF